MKYYICIKIDINVYSNRINTAIGVIIYKVNKYENGKKGDCAFIMCLKMGDLWGNLSKKKVINLLKINRLITQNVELEGVEPSSKQGSHMLSTCLSLPSVFVHKQDQSHPLIP